MFCAICLINPVKIYRKLPCGHKFCVDCIEAWETINPQCPMCRRTTASPKLNWPTSCIFCGQTNCSDKHSHINHVIEIEWRENKSSSPQPPLSPQNINENEVSYVPLSSQIFIGQELSVSHDDCDSFSTQGTFSVSILE